MTEFEHSVGQDAKMRTISEALMIAGAVCLVKAADPSSGKYATKPATTIRALPVRRRGRNQPMPFVSVQIVDSAAAGYTRQTEQDQHDAGKTTHRSQEGGPADQLPLRT